MYSKGYQPKREFTLKQKLAGTFLCLLLYRALSFIPLPFADPAYIQALVSANGSLGLLNLFSGGSLGNMSVMALGIGPWITASIILQLVGVAFPSFAALNKEEDGKRTYKIITFALAVAFAFVESIGILIGFGRAGYLNPYAWYTVLVPALLMMTGTGFLSLMGWYMDERLFGNGTSLILTTGILCSYVDDFRALFLVLTHDRMIALGIFLCVFSTVGILLLFLYTVFVSSCEKRIPIVYSRKLSGNGSCLPDRSDIPLKLMSGGVVPVIFASTIMTFPALLGSVFGLKAPVLEIFNTNSWLKADHPWASIGFVFYIGLIIAFGYFCQIMYVNPVELSKSLQKKGATIPGVRPGKPTTDYITGQARWLTALGGICLCVIAAVPMAVSGIFGISGLSFLGTSILITVSTLSDAWKTWNTQKLSQTYRAKIFF